MRLDWIFLPRENPCTKFYIIIIIMIIIIIIIIIFIDLYCANINPGKEIFICALL